MKKKGFTLAELLITMGIIGIVAAILAPSLGNLKPDSDKAKVLKVYNTISKINEEMLNDPSLYASDGNCEGFECTDVPDNPEFHNVHIYTSRGKYKCLLIKHLDLAEDITDEELGNSWFGDTEITTRDGINMTINTINTTNNSEGTMITIDTDSSANSKNCFYNSSTCPKPDRFRLFVENDGSVVANDPLTKAYINNPKKMNDKKADYDTAKSDTTTNWFEKKPDRPIVLY